MTKKSTARPYRYAQPKRSFEQTVSWFGVVVAAILIFLGGAGVLWLQQPLSERQDIRRSADVSDGLAVVTTSASSDPLTTGELHTIDFYITTNGAQVDGVQLSFTITGSALGDEAPNAIVLTEAGLQSLNPSVTQQANGYRVVLTGIPLSLAESFSATQPSKFAQISFVPIQTGTVSIDFDQTNSLATIANSNPVQNTMNVLVDQQWSVIDPNDTQTDPGDTGTDDDTGTTDDNGTDTSTNSGQTQDNNQESTTGTGGVTYKQCNETCQQNSECQAGLSCVSGRCRNPLNSGDTSCKAANPTPTPSPSPSSSTSTTTTTTTRTFASCNQGCSKNADCQNNLRCYQGQCRLATNPTSSSCSTAPVVGSNTTPPTKGGGTDEQTSGQGSSGSAMDRDDYQAMSPAPVSDFDVEMPSAADKENLLETMLNNLRQRGGSFSLAMIVSGALILILVLALLALKSLRGGRSPKSVTRVEKALYQPSAKDSGYMSDLQKKINSLQGEQPAAHTATTTFPVQPAAPMAKVEATGDSTQPSETPPTPTIHFTQPTHTPTSTPPTPVMPSHPTPHSSMLDKVKARGLDSYRPSTPQADQTAPQTANQVFPRDNRPPTAPPTTPNQS